MPVTITRGPGRDGQGSKKPMQQTVAGQKVTVLSAAADSKEKEVKLTPKPNEEQAGDLDKTNRSTAAQTGEAGKKVETEKVPTAEELAEQRRQFNERMWGDTTRKPKANVPEPSEQQQETTVTEQPEGATQVKDKAEKPADAKPGKTEKEKPKAEGEQGATTEEEQTEVETQPRVQGIDFETPKPNVKPVGKTMAEPEPPPVAGLSKHQELQIRDLQELESINPKYRNIVQDTLAFWKMEQAYASDWKKNNPSEDYDPEDERHLKFYDKHQPGFDEYDLEEAKQSRMERVAEERAVARMSTQQSHEAVAREMKDSVPRIREQARRSMFEMIGMAAPEVLEALTKDKDGKIAQDEYEMELDILDRHGEEMEAVLFEMQYLLEFSGHYQPDNTLQRRLPSKRVIYPHAILKEFGKDLQEELARKPAEKTMRDGKKFMPTWEFYKRVDSITKSPRMEEHQKDSALRDLEQKYWILQKDDVKKAYIADKAEQAAEEIGKIRKYVEKRSGKTPKPETNGEQGQHLEGDKTGGEGERKGRKPNPPSSLSGFSKVNPTALGSSKGGQNSTIVDQKMGWRPT